MSRDEDRAVLEHRQVRLAAEQVELLGLGPRLAAGLRPEEQRLLKHLVARVLVLMEGGEQQFPRGQLREARLVVVRLAQGNTFTVEELPFDEKRLPPLGSGSPILLRRIDAG